MFLPSAWTPTSYDRDRDTFRQSRKTAANFTASKSTTIIQTDVGDDLDGPGRQGPTREAQRAQRERKEKQQTLRCHMRLSFEPTPTDQLVLLTRPLPWHLQNK